MEDKRQYVSREEYLTVDCPAEFCQAKAGYHCQTKNGDVLTASLSHLGRKALAADNQFTGEARKILANADYGKSAYPAEYTPMFIAQYTIVHTDPDGRTIVKDGDGYLYWITPVA